MKACILFTIACGTVACSWGPTPYTQIQVSDANGDPVANFPLVVKLSPGLRHTPFVAEFGMPRAPEAPEGGNVPIEVSTSSHGGARVHYSVLQDGPSGWPNRSVTVIPARDLPKGSRIEVSFPAPE